MCDICRFSIYVHNMYIYAYVQAFAPVNVGECMHMWR